MWLGCTLTFNGYCFEFGLVKVDDELAVYRTVLKPWLAFLRLRNDHYIFHNQSLAEQTKEVFLDYGMASFDIKIRDGDHKRTFTVQYDESDYNFLHRHWEEHGLYYWYEYTANNHPLMLSDYSMACEPIAAEPAIAWHHDGGASKQDKISSWQAIREVVPSKVTFASFDFKTPTPATVTDTSHHRQGDIHKIEVYRYLGTYGYQDNAMGKLLAKRKMEQIDAAGKRFAAISDSRYIQPGRWFRLKKDSLSQDFQGSSTEFEFMILRARHNVNNNLLNTDGGEARYSNSFTCLRRNIRWRPPIGLNSEIIKVPGGDTATVVGPAGEEICTDKYGRIKVQFHWDRIGKSDEKSSAWVRVMTPWAAKSFAMISLPRVGTEVVVQYRQGNPDRPLVVDQLYNQNHMPPWELPANQTQSGILSRSSKGAARSNANALRFEDKKGHEQVFIQAERNMDVLVKHDDRQTIGNDRVITVHGKHTEKIDLDMSVTLDGGIAKAIKKGMSLKVLEGQQTSTVKRR